MLKIKTMRITTIGEDWYEELLPEGEWTLSDFCELPVLRRGATAEVVMAWYLGDREKPCRLVGFMSAASNDDYTIREEAWEYYNKLKEEAGKIHD